MLMLFQAQPDILQKPLSYAVSLQELKMLLKRRIFVPSNWLEDILWLSVDIKWSSSLCSLIVGASVLGNQITTSLHQRVKLTWSMLILSYISSTGWDDRERDKLKSFKCNNVDEKGNRYIFIEFIWLIIKTTLKKTIDLLEVTNNQYYKQCLIYS